MTPGTPEVFTPEERALLAPYFTNLDGPVFALTNLPEVVKGALFARYSRSPKSLRRLFLDEFAERGASPGPAAAEVGVTRAEQLYERVFVEYGDDSVAQLGGVHLACEGVSNILTKLLEWGRLMAYLEQSTRYIPYTDRPGGRWRYHVPDIPPGAGLASRSSSPPALPLVRFLVIPPSLVHCYPTIWDRDVQGIRVRSTTTQSGFVPSPGRGCTCPVRRIRRRGSGWVYHRFDA